MRVMYVIPGIGRSGGAERSLAAMAPQLTRRGIELDVVVFTDRLELAPDFERAGATVSRLAGGNLVQVTRQLHQRLRRRRPDLVHTTLFEADVAGRVAALSVRIPVVSSLVGLNYGPEHRRDPAIRTSRLAAAQLLDAATAQGVTRFHSISAYLAATMMPRLGVRRKAVDVIPRGRSAADLGEPSITRRAEVRARLGLRHQPVILGAGRQDEPKGMDDLVRAFRIVRTARSDAVLLLAGRPGHITSRIEELIHSLDLEAAVLRLGSRADIPDLLCATDVFAMPSRWEGLGSILIEAMGLGTTTVASDIAPIRELAGSPTWLTLVPPRDPSALADALVNALEDRDTARRRSELARGRFRQHYEIEQISAAMVDFYERAASGPGVP